MNFSDALLLIKDGNRLARSGWNKGGMWVGMMPGYPNGVVANEATLSLTGLTPGSEVIIDPYLVIWPGGGKLVPWVARQTDLLAEDWELVR